MPNLLSVTPLDGLGESQYDLFLCALGYETRSRFIAETYMRRARNKVAIAFPAQKQCSRASNETWFRANSYRIHEVADNAVAETVAPLLDDLLSAGTQAEYRIAVDISCLSRIRLAALVDLLRRYHLSKPLAVDFLYALARYSPPPEAPSRNTHVGPVLPAFAGWTTEPDRNSAAIVGLGYEQDKALGAIEHLQAAHEWIFEPVSTIPEYTTALHAANRSLLDRIPKSHLLRYKVEAPFTLFAALESLVYGLAQDVTPVLLPFGPKIFALCTLVVACIYDNVAVWRVSGGELEEVVDRVASGYVGGLSIRFSPGSEAAT